MERYDIRQGEWMAEKAEAGDFVLYADAQATIAALQAQVKELEQWVQDQSTANLETMRHMDEMQSRAMDAEYQLTQRTAELEAAKAQWTKTNAEYERVSKVHSKSQAELERVRADNKALNKWRADVTVSLQRPEGAFFVDVPQHIKDLVKERDELRTLIAALPKVEGEIEIYTGKNTSQVVVTYNRGVIIGTLYGLDHAKPVAALYKHRQGMEG